MADYCNCGAQLPPDAAFCHKCGRPQRDIEPVEPPDTPEVQPAAPELQFQQPVPEPRPGMRDRLTVRVAALAALVATALSFLPYLNWIAAGVFSVFLYCRRSGRRVNVEGGVRLGWITGLMTFVILGVLLGLCVAALNSLGGVAGMQAQLKNGVDPNVLNALKLLENGSEFAKVLAQLFVQINILTIAGGAIGSKIAGQRS